MRNLMTEPEDTTAATPVEPAPSADPPMAAERDVEHAETKVFPPPSRSRFAARAAIGAGARGAAGIIGTAIAVAAVVGGAALPGDLHRITPPAVSVTPVPAAQQRVCPGPLLRPGDESGQAASTVSSLGRASVQSQAVGGTVQSSDLASTDNAAAVPPQVLTLPPEADSPRDAFALAGSQSELIDADNLVGFAVAECAEAGGDSWLVGGATSVGRTTLITLSNPSAVLATVDLTVFGESGPVAAPGGTGIVVPPGVQRIMSLAGFAPGLSAPVIRVQSRGGLVVANLQQTTTRTLDPGGVDIVGGTAAPSTTTVIPGLVIAGADALTAARAEPGFEDLDTTLRMLLPGAEDADVTITIERESQADAAQDAGAVADSGASGDTTFEFRLAAGRVSDVPLAGLVDGRYTVTIDSEAPVVAGVRASTLGAENATDFAWLAAGIPLEGSALVSVAPGPSPLLHLVNPGDDDATVTLESATGAVDIEIAAGRAISTPVDAGAALALAGLDGVLASVSYFGDGQAAAFTITTPEPASRDIMVYR
jgi:hypothetical protein